MKLALVVHDFDPGYGQGRYAVELAHRLAPQHEVHVYANRFAVPLEPHITYQKVPAWRRTSLFTLLTFIPAAQRLLHRRRYDLIHAQGLTCWDADVITAHICNAARCQQDPPRWRSRPFFAVVNALERRFYQQRRARALLAVSRRVGTEIAEHYGWRHTVQLVYHGVDSTRFCPPATSAEKRQLQARFQVPAAPWVWLFIGEAIKGLREVIGQLAAFPEASLLVVSRSNLDPYRSLAASLGVSARVRFHGSETAVHYVYQAVDLLVYPSQYDAFGLVVAEAMACGLPVLVGKTIGAAEWIDDRVNGLLCDPSQPESLQTQLRWLRAVPDRAGGLGRAARVTARQHDWDACATATAAVYAQVLASRNELA